MSKLDTPVSWAISTLGECVDIVGGATPESSKSAFFTSPGAGVPWVTPADLGKQKEKYISNGIRDLTKAGFESCSTQMLPTSSILFSSRAPIGHVAISANPICTNQGFKSIKASPHFDSVFLYYYFKFSKEKIAAMGSGTTFKEVSGSVMKQVEIVVPPLGEQKRIAEKIEAIQTKINEIETRVSQAEELITKCRDALLQKAFRGELAPQDSDDEPVSKLLSKIQNEGTRKNERDILPPITDENAPFEIPRSWTWVRMGTLTTGIDAGWSPKCEGPARTSDNFWGVLKISAVSWGKYNPSAHKALPQNLEGKPSAEVRAGDVLLSRSNTRELVARSVYVPTTPPKLMLSDLIIRVNFPTHLVDPRYINLVNNASFSRSYYERIAKGASSTMCKVSRGDILNLPIPLPPYSEQIRIVQLINAAFERQEQLGQLFDRLKKILTGTEESTLKSAFSGELVPQVETEGTGHDLLEKIKTQSEIDKNIAPLNSKAIAIKSDKRKSK